MQHVKKMIKILKILKYGLIYENKYYNVISLYYDKNINEFVFMTVDCDFFCVCDLNNYTVANK